MSLRSWSPEPSYESEEDDLIADFYAPCLARAINYDRITGFFSSGVYMLIWPELRDFVERGGHIRIICSPRLSEPDVAGLQRGYAAHDDDELSAVLVAELEAMLASDVMRRPAQALAGLVAAGVVQVKLALVAATAAEITKRMFHDKVGLFADEVGDMIGFRGSANETYLGLASNVESIDAFPSWLGDRDEKRARKARERFELLWNGLCRGVVVRDLPAAFLDSIESAAADGSWQEVADELAAIELANEPEGLADTNLPSLRRHQEKALSAWYAAGRRGILAHATGSGKTITGITAIWQHASNGGHTLVVVPSDLLQSQWAGLIRQYIGDTVRVHLAGGKGGDTWRTFLSDWLDDDEPRVVVAITNTAGEPSFVSQAGASAQLLVVADEAHRLGSRGLATFLDGVQSAYRLGLSATPERAGDPDGTSRLLDYFGGVIDTFSLKDAIKAELLCKYRYVPHTVALSADEQEDWDKQTRRIKRTAAIVATAPAGDMRQRKHFELTRLLMRRASIGKQAAGKVALAANVVQERYVSGERWLVYCDDGNQLEQVRAELRRRDIDSLEYRSAMDGDKQATLQHFRLNGGVLVSIKCLDEGIDIPDASHALILASSRNPREFIQRRGRVLRPAPRKPVAEIHDAIVTPAGQIDDDGTKLVWAEVARAAQFAADAINNDARYPLEEMCMKLGLDLGDLYRLLGSGDEDDA